MESNYPDTKHGSLPVLGITLSLALQTLYPFLKHKCMSVKKRKSYINLCNKNRIFPPQDIKRIGNKIHLHLKHGPGEGYVTNWKILSFLLLSIE